MVGSGPRVSANSGATCQPARCTCERASRSSSTMRGSASAPSIKTSSDDSLLGGVPLSAHPPGGASSASSRPSRPSRRRWCAMTARLTAAPSRRSTPRTTITGAPPRRVRFVRAAGASPRLVYPMTALSSPGHRDAALRARRRANRIGRESPLPVLTTRTRLNAGFSRAQRESPAPAPRSAPRAGRAPAAAGSPQRCSRSRPGPSPR